MRPTLIELLQMDIQKMGAEELRAHIARLKMLRKKDLRQFLEDESLGRPECQGFIYIFSNPAMPGLLKIGFTSGTAEKRAAELSTTGVPEPYRIGKAFPVYASPRKAEKKVHDALDRYREAENREFFRLPVEEAMILVQAVLDGQS